MSLRLYAFRFAAAVVFINLAFGVAPASAGSPAYWGHAPVIVAPPPAYQSCSCCNTCGTRGLFTSVLVQPSPCGYAYSPCTPMIIQPQVYDYQPQPQYYRPQLHHYRHYEHHDYPRRYQRPVRVRHHYSRQDCVNISGQWLCR